MTIEQFDLTGFTGNMQVEYDGETYDLMSVNFQERLIAFNIDTDDDLCWVRCENVRLKLPEAPTFPKDRSN